VPQALNRYAATPVGQPGVYQADVSSGISGVVETAIRQVPGLVADKVVTELTSNLASRTVYKTVPTGVARIALQGARRNLDWRYLDEFIVLESVSSRLANGFLQRPLSFVARSFRIRTMVGRAYIGETAEEIAQYQLRLQRSGITARILSREFDEIIDATATSASRSTAEALGGALGVGIGGVINAGIQYAYDYNNPYLTGFQKIGRASISGGFGFLAGGAGLYVAGIWGGPVGIGVAFTLGVLFELEVVPWVFERVGAVPTRDLLPLTIP
jgi:hypothetical protein